MNVNRLAIIAMIMRAEGTATSPVTKAGGYDVIVTGADGKPEIFTDFSSHPFAHGRPAKLIRPGLYSTASGGLQQKLANWMHYAALLGLKDFGPDSQNAIAIQQMEEAGALSLIDAGRFDEVIPKIAHLWASLPGAGYGQPETALYQVRSFYVAAGGTFQSQA